MFISDTLLFIQKQCLQARMKAGRYQVERLYVYYCCVWYSQIIILVQLFPCIYPSMTMFFLASLACTEWSSWYGRSQSSVGLCNQCRRAHGAW